MITTVCADQGEILSNIAKLHNNSQPFQVDLTWGKGGFWRGSAAFLAPAIRMDLLPTDRVNLIADVRALPFQKFSIDSMVFDPPFIHAPGKASVMGQRFSGYPRQADLGRLYHLALESAWFSLKPGGLLVFKCQDIVESGKQVWNHWKIMTAAFSLDFTLEDLFVLTRRSVIVGHNHHGRQQHARKSHSYFLVFRNS